MTVQLFESKINTLELDVPWSMAQIKDASSAIYLFTKGGFS
jgi:hypothetical protein